MWTCEARMISPQVRKKAVELISKRYPLSVVAEEVGISLQDVYRIRDDAGLDDTRPDPSPGKIRLAIQRIQAKWTNTQWESHRVEKPTDNVIPMIRVADLHVNNHPSLLDIFGHFPENK